MYLRSRGQGLSLPKTNLNNSQHTSAIFVNEQQTNSIDGLTYEYQQRAHSYMFSVHDPGRMFSKQVLGTRAFRLRALWNVLGTPSFRFKIGTHLGLRSMTYCVYIHCATCEVILMGTLRADSGLRAKSRPLRTCSRFHIVQTSFRRHTKGGGDLFREHGLTVFQLELF